MNNPLSTTKVKTGSLRWWIYVVAVIVIFTACWQIFTPRHRSPGLGKQVEVIAQSAPAPTDEMVDYAVFFDANSAASSDALLSFGAQNALLQDDPELIYTEEWVRDTASAIVMVQAAFRECVDYNPLIVPPEYADMHQENVIAARLYLEAMDKYIEGVDAMDIDILTESIGLINEANEHLVNAASYLQ